MCATGVGQPGEMENGPVVFQLPQTKEAQDREDLAWDAATVFFLDELVFQTSIAFLFELVTQIQTAVDL